MCRTACLFLLTVITCSITFAQDKSPPSVIAQEEATPQSLSSFRRQLIKAAEDAQREGEITRAELFKIRVTSLSRPALVKMQQAVVEQATFEGKIVAGTPISAIDWSSLLQFIKEALPIILEIIKLLA
jgi:hypothetical protein